MLKTGTLENGFVYEIDDNAANNMEFLDVLAEVEENPLKVSKAADMLLGKDQKKALYDHIRKDGRVDVEEFMESFTAIMESAGEETKN